MSSSKFSQFAFSIVAVHFFFISVCNSSQDFARQSSDNRPVWALTPSEQFDLEASQIEYRAELITALRDAIEIGIPRGELERPYLHDSEAESIQIPRSILNRILLNSLNLEITTTRLFFFCDNKCENNLATKIENSQERDRTLLDLKKAWPSIESFFREKWSSATEGIWKRIIFRAAYAKYLSNEIRFQARSHGIGSMALGSAAFTGAFIATEALEFLYAGPVHLLCQANYFWSIAIGASVASLYGDFSAISKFVRARKEHELPSSGFQRVRKVIQIYFDSKSRTKIEERILYRSAMEGTNTIHFEKLSRKDSYQENLQGPREQIYRRTPLAANSLLWAELAWALKQNEMKLQDRDSNKDPDLFLTAEIDNFFNMVGSENELQKKKAQAYWLDLAQSLKTLLEISLQYSHIHNTTRSSTFSILGKLDRLWRDLKILIELHISDSSFLEKRDADWLRNVIAEWVAINLDANDQKKDHRELFLRITNLGTDIELSLKHGRLVTLNKENFGTKSLLKSLEISNERKLCHSIFKAPIIHKPI